MKKTLFSTLALVGMIGVGAITSHAEDNAEAVTTISANVISGGMEITTVPNVDFGAIKINTSSSKTQDVTVTNLTGKPNVQLTAKLDSDMPTGVTLASMGTGDNGKLLSTVETPLVGVSKPTEVDGVSDYKFDWKMSAGLGSVPTSSDISRVLTFTASSTI